MTNYRYLAFRADEPTVAVIDCLAPNDAPKRRVLQNLRTGVCNWLGLTGEGREAWMESSEDFNWGDLAHHCSDPKLITHLKAQGIFSLSVDVYSGEYFAERLVFDEIFYPTEEETR